MSTDKPPKKRKVGDGGNGGTDDGTTTSLAAIWAEMKDMKGRLSRMDELENEMDGMRCGQLSEVDSMKFEINDMSSKKNVKYNRRIWISWRTNANCWRENVIL